MKRLNCFKMGIFVALILAGSVRAGASGSAAGDVKRVIPQRMKDILELGIPTRETRGDIPFQIADVIFLPAQTKMYTTFIRACT